MSKNEEKNDSVRVALRVRPCNSMELLEKCATICKYPRAGQIVIGNDRAFTFDYVYAEDTTQDQIYTTTVAPLVDSFLNGYNATILAYGQTGSGKTFTMGTSSNKDIPDELLGILPRVVNQIFSVVKASPEDHQYNVRISFLEIHNEDIIDLLDPQARESKKTPTIRETPEGEIIVQNIVEEEVKNEAEMLGCLEKGSLQRATGSTLMNAQSSRSHAIFTVLLTQVYFETNVQTAEAVVKEQLSSKFHFVDLAGSERLKRTGAVGDRMKEGISINSGLLALGNVISALGDERRKAAHVPFRDSKITRLLQDSLGGNSKTMMIACVSPADINYEETLNTLKYANRARNIQNKAVINRDPMVAKIDSLKNRISELEAALASGGISVPGPLKGAAGESGPFAFQPSNEEMQFIKDQNATYEGEIQRLTSKLKEARAQMGTLSSTLINIETQRDAYRVRLQHAREVLAKLDNPPDLGLDGELDDKEVDVIQENIRQKHELQHQLAAAHTEIRLMRQDNDHLRQLVFSEVEAPIVHVKTPRAGKTGRAVDDSVVSTPIRKVSSMSQISSSGQRRESMSSATVSLAGVGDLFVPPIDDDASTANGDDEDADAEDVEEVKALKTLAEVKDREHTFAMQSLTDQHDRLDQDIVQKELLVQQLLKTRETANAMRRHYEHKISEMEIEVKQVQDQKALEEGKQSDQRTKELIQSYEKRLTSLRGELAHIKDKLQENQRMQQVKARDEAVISKLKSEIEFQRKEKVKLSKKMKEESDKHRAWMKGTTNKLKNMEKEARVNSIKMKQMQSQFEKQAAVLKKRTEEKDQMARKLQQYEKQVAAGRAVMRVQNRELVSRMKGKESTMLSGSRTQMRDRARSRSALVKGAQSFLQVAGLTGASAPISEDEEEEGEEDHTFLVAQDNDAAVSQLKAVFDEEIDNTVSKLEVYSRHSKLVEKRDKAIEDLRNAESIVSSADAANMPEEELDYWQDRAEALSSEMKYLNSQIVASKIEMSKYSDAPRATVFDRHRISRLPHSRAVILHLMDQLVQMKRNQEHKLQEVEDLKLTAGRLQTDLKRVTRQSLLLQSTPSAKDMLREMDELDAVSENKQSDNDPLNHFLDALHHHTSPDIPALTKKALSLPQPLFTSTTPPSPRSVATDGDGGSTRRSNGGSGLLDRPAGRKSGHQSDHSRENSPRNSPRGESHRRTRSGARDANEAKKKRPATAAASGGGEDDDHEDSGVRKPKSVFDRLTDSNKFTGVARNMRKEPPKGKKDAKKPHSEELGEKSPESLPSTNTPSVSALSEDRDAEAIDEKVERKSFTRPETAPPNTARGRPTSKNVFSRLTDTSSYTGMYKQHHQDTVKTKDVKPKEEAAVNRTRSLSQMESELEAMSENWSNVKKTTRRRKDKDKPTKGKKRDDKDEDEEDDDAVIVATVPQIQLTPSTPAAVTSPIEKSVAMTAVKRLDSLFDRFRKTKQRLDQDPSDTTVTASSPVAAQHSNEHEDADDEAEDHKQVNGKVEDKSELARQLAAVLGAYEDDGSDGPADEEAEGEGDGQESSIIDQTPGDGPSSVGSTPKVHDVLNALALVADKVTPGGPEETQ